MSERVISRSSRGVPTSNTFSQSAAPADSHGGWFPPRAGSRCIGGVRQGVEAGDADLGRAAVADAVRAVLDPGQGPLDLGQLVRVQLGQVRGHLVAGMLERHVGRVAGGRRSVRTRSSSSTPSRLRSSARRVSSVLEIRKRASRRAITHHLSAGSSPVFAGFR